MKELLSYIVDEIEKRGLKYEIHAFDSGAAMIDIWIDSRFYVIQLDEDAIGLSLITGAATPFSTVPDQSFKSADAFKAMFEKILP